MLKNLYLAGIAVAALGAAALLPRLADDHAQSSLLTALVGDVSPKQIDRLVVGNPVGTVDASKSQ